MNAPPGLLAAALLFWGHQTGLFVLALPCAALLEAWRLTDRRFELARLDYSRLSDASAVLFFGMAVYLYATHPANTAFMGLSSWLPLAFVPLLAAQLYSAKGRVDVRALFVFMRNQPAEPAWLADISYPYLILCVLAAGAANNRTALFYPEMSLVVGWAMWRARPAGSSAAAWVGLLALACALGYEGHLRLARLQTSVETAAVRLIFGAPKGGIDPDESVTSLGHIGRLKESDRIVLRLTPAPGREAPRLLRAASYNAYRARRWLAWDAAFAPAREAAGAWSFGPATPGASKVSIAAFVEEGSGLLPLPPGTALVKELSAGTLSRSRLGAVKLDQGPALAVYDAEFSASAPLDGPPDRRDLEVPPGEAPLLAGIVKELGLSPRRPRQALAALQDHFDRNFRYSLYREGPDPGVNALEEFLLKTRAGHCEYFATATVLLLRAAGIPARYAAGFSVQEYSRLERAWIVRDRHAHAWALAYVDGAWAELDTTPASWASIEAGRPRWFGALRDACAWASFRVSRWRGARGAGGAGKLWLWLLAAPLGLLVWKWLAEIKAVATRVRAAASSIRPRGPGGDWPWYAVERRLAAEGYPRHPWESWPAWLDRVASTPGSAVDAGTLRPLLELHGRARFDPAGLAAEQGRVLGRGVDAWLRARAGARR